MQLAYDSPSYLKILSIDCRQSCEHFAAGDEVDVRGPLGKNLNYLQAEIRI